MSIYLDAMNDMTERKKKENINKLYDYFSVTTIFGNQEDTVFEKEPEFFPPIGGNKMRVYH